MQQWMNQHPIFIPFYFAGWFVFVFYWIALTSGWRLLAQRFRLQGTFTGEKWTRQSVHFRTFAQYNRVLIVGADRTGLFIAPMFILRPWHPPLFVPWNEISAPQTIRRFFFTFIELRLGRSEQIPFRISPTLAAEVEAAAGAGWPVGYHRAMELQPPAIG
jgi:hypothetical protein